jgi:pimeloyl-ACP methyl ester carboxylesterase
MTIVYIHGASATSESFTHIREHISMPDLAINYDSNNGFANNLRDMKQRLDDVEKIFFVAHSLGGIYALHLADYFKHKTLGGVTISTPYGGSKEADFALYFLPFSRLMRDIGPTSAPMAHVKDLKFPADKWTNIVTTVGKSPWINEPNDGVVTLESMRHIASMELIELPLNHYEVVISNQTVDIIKERIKRTPLGPH